MIAWARSFLMYQSTRAGVASPSGPILGFFGSFAPSTRSSPFTLIDLMTFPEGWVPLFTVPILAVTWL